MITIIVVGIIAFYVGFIVSAWFSIGRIDDLVIALARLVENPRDENARGFACNVLLMRKYEELHVCSRCGKPLTEVQNET